MDKECFNALMAIQKEVGDLKKDASNPFFKSSYADLNQVLDMLKPLFIKHDFILAQMPDVIDGMSVLTTILFHKSGDELRSHAALVSKDPNDPQKLGSAITYMRRYSLISMFGLKAVDDDGNDASTTKKKADLHDEDMRDTVVDQVRKDINACKTSEELEAYWEEQSGRVNKKPGRLMYLQKHFPESHGDMVMLKNSINKTFIGGV